MSYLGRKFIENNINNILNSSLDENSDDKINLETKNSIHIILPFEFKYYLKKPNEENNHKTINKFINTKKQINYFKRKKLKKEKLLNIYNKSLNNINEKKISLSTILTHYYDGINKHYLHKELLYNKYYSNYKNNYIFTQEKSNGIFSEVVNDIFLKIFKILDSDEDNLISPITITNSIKNIPEKIKKILKNFFQDFQKTNIILCKENFIELMKDLYNDLSQNEKQILCEEYREKKYSLKKIKKKHFYYYKPKINERSRSMAHQYKNKIISEMEKRKLICYDTSQRDFEKEKKVYFRRYKLSSPKNNNSSLKPFNEYTFKNFKNSIVYN